MLVALIIILVAIVGFAVFYICKEYIKRPKKKDQEGSRAILKNKKFIENMVANVESVLVYADGNDALCHRLVQLKDDIKFFNPSKKEQVLTVDSKIANKLDDLKIVVAKDNTQDTCFRLLEEVEAYVVQRKKEEQSL